MTPRWTRISSTVGIMVLAAAARAPGVFAQLPEFPTLGAEYISKAGGFQVSVSGQLDLEGFHTERGWKVSPTTSTCETCHVNVARRLRQEDGTLGTHRLRIFVDLFAGDHIYSLIEARSDGGSDAVDGSPRSEIRQAFVRFIDGSGDVGVQIGRFSSPFGAYPARHLSTEDYFVRPPLAYEYRTVMNRWRVPVDALDFLYWKDTPDDIDRPGSPPVWEVPYQWGAMVFGRLGPVDLRAAVMNSAPSSGPKSWRFEWDRYEHPSWVFGARMKPSASIEIGVSYSRGPWMEDVLAGTIGPPPGSPAGSRAPGISEFDQEILSADVKLERGSIMMRAEALFDRWRVPNVAATPRDVSINVEIQGDLVAGFFAAVRGGLIDFRPIDDGLGVASPLNQGKDDWDYDVYRYEGSLGYRMARNAGLLLSASKQVQAEVDDGDHRLIGIRLWWAF